MASTPLFFVQTLGTSSSEGQSVSRAMNELMGMRNVLVINDEAHHCYREKVSTEEKLKGDDLQEANKNNEAAWETLHSDVSRPFARPASGRIAVKVINHLGDEVMKVLRV